MSDLIDREALLRQIDIDSEGEPGYYGDTWKFIDTIKSMPPAELGTNLAEVGTDCISRQAAISAICNACGKIDCAQVDKCEKLQLPPANCSEIPNNSDMISRQQAIDALAKFVPYAICDESTESYTNGLTDAYNLILQLPSAQPEIHHCIDCTLYDKPECLMAFENAYWAEPYGYCHMFTREEADENE